jgi:hypothetical protein
MGKRGRAVDKGKGEDDDLIGILKVVAISTSTWLFLIEDLVVLSLDHHHHHLAFILPTSEVPNAHGGCLLYIPMGLAGARGARWEGE